MARSESGFISFLGYGREERPFSSCALLTDVSGKMALAHFKANRAGLPFVCRLETNWGSASVHEGEIPIGGGLSLDVCGAFHYGHRTVFKIAQVRPLVCDTSGRSAFTSYLVDTNGLVWDLTHFIWSGREGDIIETAIGLHREGMPPMASVVTTANNMGPLGASGLLTRYTFSPNRLDGAFTLSQIQQERMGSGKWAILTDIEHGHDSMAELLCDIDPCQVEINVHSALRAVASVIRFGGIDTTCTDLFIDINSHRVCQANRYHPDL